MVSNHLRFIGKIGSNPSFISWNAHMFFAYAVAYTFHSWWVAAAVIVGAGLKEFYLDKHFGMARDFQKSLVDWLGYTSGVLLALAARAWL
ncbi:MAG TPA: hypothetical protein VMS08_03510 [Candidatus Saccharimonadia bacterium]|nr:hypothetical protein [Candidatus Saccharimonadia bacterium]